MSDNRANRRYYLSRGLCPRCGGKNRVQDGRCLCVECQQKHDEEQRNRRDLWRESGRCTRCGAERDSEKKMCAKCREYMADIRHQNAKNAKKRRDKLREAGMCTRCGKTWAESGRTTCKKCANRHNQYCKNPEYRAKQYERRQKRIEAGLCIDCGRPAEDGKQRCPRCIEMRQDSTRKYSIMRTIKREAERTRRETNANHA